MNILVIHFYDTCFNSFYYV